MIDNQLPLPQLRSMVDGQVIVPGDDGYDAARALLAGGFDRRPAAIVRPDGAAGVAAAVGVARDVGVPLSVRAGGHSAAGHGVIDDGLVVDVRGLTGLDIDLETRTAWAGGGLTAGAYTTAAAEHGLATGFGDTGSVGIGGITLGGGVGHLSRLHGLTIDNLLAAEVVTADGPILHVDADTHPDLFWAIRGGGGNFGVVTRFRYRLHELPSIVGGLLLLPATAENIAAFAAAAAAAPDQLSTIATVMPAPPLPFVPAHLRGQLVIMGTLCYAGPAEAGRQAIAPFRGIATPVADLVRPMPYPGLFPPDDPAAPRPVTVGTTGYLDHVDLATAETIVAHLTRSDAPLRLVQLRVLGGAISRVPDDATAYGHRAAKVMVNVVSMVLGPQDRPGRRQWVDELTAALDQDVPGSYVNFVSDDGPQHARSAYPSPTWERLAAVKAAYDPANLFRSNHNIPPARA
ncbi:FAD-binding oxidoreductase [Jiangella ureilytica]|uniref:FAD-binding oxidoreductase n=1 Tax=Jiangella ureilytica TaxID=2530374 RepID=A0A4R4RHG2_9ACTN|nr:FAD-binding oxidoreductase [Jiangella ureilytica]TDC47883.1 FAD-binding oxidoreductase [Jiangella ureilytica]